MRVVNDFSGQEDVAAGKSAPCLIRVVHGAIHAVAEAEFAREMNGEPPVVVAESAGADVVHERAVVRGGKLPGDGLLHVEAFAEDQGLRWVHVSGSDPRCRARNRWGKQRGARSKIASG